MDKGKYKEKEFFADECRELVDLNHISLLVLVFLSWNSSFLNCKKCKKDSVPLLSATALTRLYLQRDEEVGDFQVPLKPPKMSKKSKSYQTAVENMTNSSCLPFNKDVASESGRTEKRKVTWSDKVALLA